MNKLKELRKENNLTLQDMSKIFSISIEAFRKYEVGEREPSQSLLIDFANHFNVTLDYLLGRTDKRYNSDKVFTEGEIRLLKAFNGLIPPMQDYILEMVEKLVSQPQNANKRA